MLKRYSLLTLLVFILSVKGFSQKYKAIDSTITWSTEEYGKLLTSCYEQSYCKYYIKGYELNNGRIWNKVFTSHYAQAMGPWNYCMTYVAPAPVYNAAFGFMWNDTINKKVYYKGSLPANYTPVNADVVYDFNKVIGDTMYLQSPMNVQYKFPINGIDSVLFSGQYHKRFLTTCGPLTPFNFSGKIFTFTEGIGCSLGALTQTVNGMGEAGSTLVCFSSPTQTMTITNYSVYANGGSCTNLVLQTPENKAEENVVIYPNPASDHLSIKNKQEKNLNYSIVNLIGNECQKGRLEGQTKTISLNELASGVYFLKLIDEGKTILTKKIIIAKD